METLISLPLLWLPWLRTKLRQRVESKSLADANRGRGGGDGEELCLLAKAAAASPAFRALVMFTLEINAAVAATARCLKYL